MDPRSDHNELADVGGQLTPQKGGVAADHVFVVDLHLVTFLDHCKHKTNANINKSFFMNCFVSLWNLGNVFGHRYILRRKMSQSFIIVAELCFNKIIVILI